VIRAGRYLNVLLGGWIVAASWFLSGATTGAKWNGVVTGLLVIALSLPRGAVRERYARWDRLVV
jgi:hypothetical protein